MLNQRIFVKKPGFSTVLSNIIYLATDTELIRLMNGTEYRRALPVSGEITNMSCSDDGKHLLINSIVENLVISHDFGETFSVLGSYDGTMYNISYSSDDMRIIAVNTENRCMLSTDYGQSWETLSTERGHPKSSPYVSRSGQHITFCLYKVFHAKQNRYLYSNNYGNDFFEYITPQPYEINQIAVEPPLFLAATARRGFFAGLAPDDIGHQIYYNTLTRYTSTSRITGNTGIVGEPVFHTYAVDTDGINITSRQLTNFDGIFLGRGKNLLAANGQIFGGLWGLTRDQGDNIDPAKKVLDMTADGQSILIVEDDILKLSGDGGLSFLPIFEAPVLNGCFSHNS